MTEPELQSYQLANIQQLWEDEIGYSEGHELWLASQAHNFQARSDAMMEKLVTDTSFGPDQPRNKLQAAGMACAEVCTLTFNIVRMGRAEYLWRRSQRFLGELPPMPPEYPGA